MVGCAGRPRSRRAAPRSRGAQVGRARRRRRQWSAPEARGVGAAARGGNIAGRAGVAVGVARGGTMRTRQRRRDTRGHRTVCAESAAWRRRCRSGRLAQPSMPAGSARAERARTAAARPARPEPAAAADRGAVAGVDCMAWNGTVGASYARRRTAARRSAALAGRAALARGAVTRPDPNSSSIDEPTPTVITPPHTEHRARTPPLGTLAGSTRKTDRHSGQGTFTSPPWPTSLAVIPIPPYRAAAAHRCADRSNTPSREASWRSSSFRSRAR